MSFRRLRCDDLSAWADALTCRIVYMSMRRGRIGMRENALLPGLRIDICSATAGGIRSLRLQAQFLRACVDLRRVLPVTSPVVISAVGPARCGSCFGTPWLAFPGIPGAAPSACAPTRSAAPPPLVPPCTMPRRSCPADGTPFSAATVTTFAATFSATARTTDGPGTAAIIPRCSVARPLSRRVQPLPSRAPSPLLRRFRCREDRIQLRPSC